MSFVPGTDRAPGAFELLHGALDLRHRGRSGRFERKMFPQMGVCASFFLTTVSIQ